MKIINKQNFFSTVCTVFTLIALGKIFLELIFQGIFENYQENLLVMFVLSLLTIFVLSQYYRFQRFPLLVVILVQYLLLISIVMILVWVSGYFHPLHENGYRDMFFSFTISYSIGVVIYYTALFREIKSVNQSLKNIKEYRDEESNENSKC